MQAQAFAELIESRRSIRAFTNQAADKATLESIFKAAQYAPSNCNTQPWQLAVASGESCERLRKRVSADWAAGKITMDYPYDGVYQDEYKDRQHGAAHAMYAAAGIERSDKEKRNAQFVENFEFFGAPHVAFLFLPEQFGIREAADLGMYAQSLMLSIRAHGLASCPQTALSFLADSIREELQIDSSMKLLFGISFGYADESAPINNCRTDRASLDETVRFYD